MLSSAVTVVRLESDRAAAVVAHGWQRGGSALIASDASRSCRVVADELSSTLAEVTGGSCLFYDGLRPDPCGARGLLCAVCQHLGQPFLPVAAVLLHW